MVKIQLFISIIYTRPISEQICTAMCFKFKLLSLRDKYPSAFYGGEKFILFIF